MNRLITFAFSVSAAVAQVTVTPPAAPISLNTPAPFTFTVDLPPGGTAVNWGTVRFYQTPGGAPSAATPWCGFNIFPNTNASGVNGVALTVYNADATVPVNLWLPNLYTTAAQRSNTFCSVAAENQITYTINATKTSMTVTVPITFQVLPAQNYRLYLSESYRTATSNYVNTPTVDAGTFPIGSSSPGPTFTLSGTNPTVAAGGSAVSITTLTPANGFNSSVTLSAVTNAAGMTGTFSPASVAISGTTSSTSNLTIAVPAGTAPGAYPMTISGTGAGITQSATITVNVTAATLPFSVTPPSGGITLNTPASFTFTFNLPPNATSINSGTVRFYQSPGATPNASTAWCGFNILAAGDTVGPAAVAITVFGNADATSQYNMWPPSLWSTAAQRSNTFCSISPETQIPFTINTAKTTMTVTIPVTFLTMPAQTYRLYISENYRTATLNYTDTAVADMGAVSVSAPSNPAAAPTFSPAAGTYATPQTITLSSNTAGASIRYTVDGSAPSTTTGTLYSAPFQVAANTTVRAIASAAGFGASSISAATYSIQAAVPVFSPAAGTFSAAQSVTLTSTTAGAAIRYTVDGSAPSATVGTVYSGPIAVAATTTIRAIAYKAGMADSAVSDATYTILTPTITSLTPTTGPTGAAITISGANFGATQGTSTVTFNGVNSGTASSWSATSITAFVPASATSGNVVVTVNGVASNAVPFTVGARPVISYFSSNSGAVGASLTINGSGFGTSQGTSTVTFNGTAAGVASFWNANTITVTVPVGTTSGDLVVTVNGIPSLGRLFVIPAVVSSVTPTSGVAGTQVTLTGTAFGVTQGTSLVWLGTTKANVVSWSDTSVVATVASGSTTGTAQVQRSGVWSNSTAFTVASPLISSVAPSSGIVGTPVTITGSGFGATQGTGQVWIGTAQGVVQSWSATQIVAQVAPGSASGVVQVLNNGSASGTVAFAVNSLQLLSASPVTGGAGTTVTLTGTGFGATQGIVTLGSTAGTVVSWSDASITATVAAGSISGVARVQVSSGALSNALGFKVPGSPTSASLIAPSMLNMLVGDSRSLQALSSTGQPMLGLTWTSSNTAVVSLSSDDPPVLSALAPGRVTIAAGGASADVVVMAGDQFPVGTTAWSTPLSGGYHSIIPAVPSATGVADVFAVSQQSISAVMSEGAVAWTAAIGPAEQTLPDFQGGMVIRHTNHSIRRLDGLTGATTANYIRGGETMVRGIAIHLDGTIFATIETPTATTSTTELVGIDGLTGAQKFSIPVDGISTGGFMLNAPVIAGDGYAYMPYATRENCDVFVHGECGNNHLRLLRVSSSGASSTIGLLDWRSGFGDLIPVSVSMITNADTGVYVSIGTNDGFFSATTNGLNVSLGGAPVLPGQESPVVPVLQAQDGSFVGMAYTPGGDYMVAFDGSGGLRWAVRGESPLMALEGGIFLAESGVRYSSGGAAMSRDGRPPVYSWPGFAYQASLPGVASQVQATTVFLAQSWLAFQGGNNSRNGTAIENPTFPELEKCTTNNTCSPTTLKAGDRIYNARKDLVSRIQGPCAAAVDKFFTDFDLRKHGRTFLFDGPTINRIAFLAYLQSVAADYDGTRSTADYLYAKCGEKYTRGSCSARAYPTVQAYFGASSATTAITVTPSEPLKVYWRPTYTAPNAAQLIQYKGFGDGIAPSNNGANIYNESVIFHEALHGMTALYDHELRSALRLVGTLDDSILISIYIKEHVLGASGCPVYPQ